MKANIYHFIGLLGVIAALNDTSTLRAEVVAELPEDTNPALLYLKEFLIHPDYGNAEFGSLFRGDGNDQEIREFLQGGSYDGVFDRLSAVRGLTTVCDWGDDLSQGPYLLLPHLARARDLGYLGGLKARIALMDGDVDQAVNVLLVVNRLAADVSSGSAILINVLVSYAIDRILVDTVSENLGRFDSTSLERLLDTLPDRPQTMSLADSIDVEKAAFLGWMERQVRSIRDEFAADPQAQWQAIAEMGKEIFDMSDSEYDFAIRDGEDRVALTLQYIEDAKPIYDELKRICEAPLGEALRDVHVLENMIETGSNPVAKVAIPSISKMLVAAAESALRRAMLFAALDIQRTGAEALERHVDPLTGAPFHMVPFEWEGSAVGFTLSSTVQADLDKRRLFLVDPTAPRLHLDGDELGRPRSSDESRP